MVRTRIANTSSVCGPLLLAPAAIILWQTSCSQRRCLIEHIAQGSQRCCIELRRPEAGCDPSRPNASSSIRSNRSCFDKYHLLHLLTCFCMCLFCILIVVESPQLPLTLGLKPQPKENRQRNQTPRSLHCSALPIAHPVAVAVAVLRPSAPSPPHSTRLPLPRIDMSAAPAAAAPASFAAYVSQAHSHSHSNGPIGRRKRLGRGPMHGTALHAWPTMSPSREEEKEEERGGAVHASRIRRATVRVRMDGG